MERGAGKLGRNLTLDEGLRFALQQIVAPPPPPDMQILDALLIRRKLHRLAAEILEQHGERARIYLIGINNNGYRTAEEIAARMRADVAEFGLGAEVVLRRLRLSPASPLEPEPVYGGDPAELAGAHVVIVDDVANTGRTAYFATKPLMGVVPASVEVCVLIDRLHKTFPVSSDYVGLTLSTGLQQDICVYYDEPWRAEIF